MGLRKSLGHSPIGFSMIGKSNFDFIPDRKPVSDKNNVETAEKEPPSKKIVSYYLEEPTINRLKQYCDEHNEPYSHTTGRAIELFLNKVGY